MPGHTLFDTESPDNDCTVSPAPTAKTPGGGLARTRSTGECGKPRAFGFEPLRRFDTCFTHPHAFKRKGLM